MQLEPGVRAPMFAVPDVGGQSFDLAAYRGRPLLLTFYRYASCPLCNVRIHDLILRWPELIRRGLQGVAVFQSPAASVSQFMAKHDAPFALLPDPEEELYALYRVDASLLALLSAKNLGKLREARKLGYTQHKIEGSVTRLPADFLIDGGGVIREAYYGKNLYDHVPYARIDQFLNDYGAGR